MLAMGSGEASQAGAGNAASIHRSVASCKTDEPGATVEQLEEPLEQLEQQEGCDGDAQENARDAEEEFDLWSDAAHCAVGPPNNDGVQCAAYANCVDSDVEFERL